MALRSVLIAICLALGGGAAAGYTVQEPREYSSTVRVFIGIDLPADGPDWREGAVYVAKAPASDFARFAASDEVAALATARIGGGAEALAEAVEAHVVADTTLVDVTATDEDPRRARDIAAAFADVVAAEESEEARVAGVTLIARVTDEAIIPEDPEPQPWLRNLGIGTGGGLLVGLVLTIARGSRSARPRPDAG